MPRSARLIITLLILTLLGGSYFTYTLLSKITLLKGAQSSLQARLERNEQALNKSRKKLAETRNQLDQTKQKLAKIEREQPKGARKLANRAAKVPLIGTIATIGLFATDTVLAATTCYNAPDTCKEGLLTLYEEGKAEAETGLELFTNRWLTEPAATEK